MRRNLVREPLLMRVVRGDMTPERYVAILRRRAAWALPTPGLTDPKIGQQHGAAVPEREDAA